MVVLSRARRFVRIVGVFVSLALIVTGMPLSALAATSVSQPQPPRASTLDTTPPVASITSPKYSVPSASGPSFAVSWLATDASGIATYTVQYKTGQSGAWTTWRTTTATARTFAGSVGRTYFFRVRAQDRAGNTGDWSAVSMTTTPHDDRSSAVSYSGNWGKASYSRAYSGTTRYAGTSGRSATMKFTGNRVAVVALKARGRGKFAVYLDGASTAYRVIDTYSSSTKYRQVVFDHTFSSYGNHTIRIKVLGTRGRTRVDLDAIAVERLDTPDFDSVAPSSAAVGELVTLSGSHFGTAKGTVTVSGIPAPVDSWSTTQVVAQIPLGATTGAVRVIESGGVSSIDQTLTITGPVEAGRGIEDTFVLAQGVNAANGNLVLSGMTSSIPGFGEGTQISSTYNSLDTSAGAAGPGWSFSFEQRLIAYPNGSEAWLQPDGSIHVFGQRADGTYVSAQGEYATLVRQADASFLLTDQEKNAYSFDAQRRLLSKTDRNGNATTFTYTGEHATSMTDASGRTSTFEYDVDGLLITVTDCADRVTDFEYDGAGRLVLMTLPLVTVGPDTVRYTISYAYDSAGRLTGVTDARGATTNYSYDGQSAKVASVTDPTDAVTSLSYDASSSTVTDAAGAVTSFRFDEAGRVTQTSGVGVVSTIDHNAQGDVTEVADSTGAGASISYDDHGRQVDSTGPDGATATYAYHEDATAGEPSVVTAPNGAETSYSYDAVGNRLSETDALGATTNYSYTDEGKSESVTDATGRTTAFSYDDSGNMIEIVEPGGATTALSYNSLGLVEEGTDAAGRTGMLTYDEFGRLLSVLDAAGVTQSYSYDANSNRTGAMDGKGNRIHSVYDDANRILEVTPEPVILSQETTGSATVVNTGQVGYAYDKLGRMSSRTDQEGNTWALSYDPATGRLSAETDAAGRTTTYSYDAAGQLAGTTFADGGSSSYSYNRAGQVASTSLNGRTTVYSYDSAGRTVSESIIGGVAVARTFDAAGRLSSESVGGRRSEYLYDAAGRVLSARPEGLAERAYTYDEAGRLEVVGAGSASVKAEYDAMGQLTTLRRSDGTSAIREYDSVGRLAALSEMSSTGTTESSRAYEYDANGSISSVRDESGTASRYFYDNLNELVNVRGASGELIANYSYDQAGSRVTSYRSGEGTTTYSYDEADTTRLRSIASPSGEIGYAYDDQGRVISKATAAGTTHFAWVAEGYLAGVTLPSGDRIAYDYDASWRMISRAHSSGGSTQTVTYVYDGDKLVAECDESGAVVASYLYGPDGRVESMRRGGEVFSYRLDERGSVCQLVDASGTVVNSYVYDDFGMVLSRSEDVANPFGYAGYRGDTTTGLYHLKSRWYDATAGRFLSKDAVRDVAGDPLSANHYLYCKNNPVNLVDPSGQWPNWFHTYTAWCMIAGPMLVAVAACYTVYYFWGAYWALHSAWGALQAQAILRAFGQAALNTWRVWEVLDKASKAVEWAQRLYGWWSWGVQQWHCYVRPNIEAGVGARWHSQSWWAW